MFFDLTNVFAIFQFYVNKTFKLYFNIFCVIYLDNMFIYFETKKKTLKTCAKNTTSFIKT